MFQLSHRYRYVKEIFVFLCIMTAIVVCLLPAHRYIQHSFLSFENFLRDKIRENVGLDVSFDSASPNIFRNLTFFNVSVVDSSSKKEIFSADRVAVSFRLLKVLSGDFFDCVKEVRIESGECSLDATEDNAVTSLIFKKDGASGEESSKAAGSGFTPESVFSGEELPLERALSGLKNLFKSGVLFNMRNFSFLIDSGTSSFSVHVGTAEAEMDSDRLAVDTNSRIVWMRSNSGPFPSVSAEVSLKGELASDFSSGFASLFVDSVEAGGFYLSRIGLVAGLKDGVISLTSLQDGQPLSISMTLDQVNKTASASFSCEKLLLFRWLASDERNRTLSSLQNTVISGTSSFSYSEETGMLYSASGSAEFSPVFYRGGILSFDFSGNQEQADISYLKLNGNDFDADFSGVFNWETKLPEGLLSVRKFSLFNGKLDFSGDFRLTSRGKKLFCRVPLLTVNRAIFSDVQADADFSSPGQYEFSLSAGDSSGKFVAEASFSPNPDKFLQIYGAFDSVSVANALGGIPGVLLKEETFSSLSNTFQSYALTTEVYFSTDFDRFSYNSPRLILASAENDGLYVIASVTGTESGFNVVDISSAPAGIQVRGNVYTIFDDYGGILFTSDFSAGGIPYAVSGMYSDRIISASGDYGFSFIFRLPGENELGSGNIFFSGLPVQAGPAVFTFSLDADFARRYDKRWGGNINSFQLEEAGGLTSLDTVLSASGSFDSSGVFLHNVSLSDAYSVLNGFASVGVMSDEVSGIRRATVELSMADFSGEEAIKIDGSLTSGMNDLLFEGVCAVRKFPLMRVNKNQQTDNLLSADLSVSGSPDMLFASANISEASCMVAGSNLNVNGIFLYEDGLFSVHDASAIWRGFRLSGIQADFSVKDLEASVDAELSGVFVRSSFAADLSARIQGSAPESEISGTGTEPSGSASVPEAGAEHSEVGGWISAFKSIGKRFYSEIAFSNISWRDLKYTETFLCSIQREPGVTVVYAGKDDALNGLLLDDGTFTLSLTGDSPVQFMADGSASAGILDVEVSDVDVDMSRLWPVVGHRLVAFDGGHVTGNFHIGGYFTDPEFDGTLRSENIVVRSPDYFPTPFDPVSFSFVANGKEIFTPPFILTGNGGACRVEASCSFNRWIPDEIELLVNNINSSRIAASVDNKYVRAQGDVFCDIKFTWMPGFMEVTGDAGFERGNFAIKFENIGEEKDPSKKKHNVNVDLNVYMGQKVEFHWPSGTFPILRGLLQADEPLHFAADTGAGTYSFRGSAALKGGEFFYFKRNFYLRQGNIIFDETQDQFDPRISLRAEVRERDEDGNNVRIIMTVDDDPLSSFNPQFSSDPLKSQFEIMEILGQIASADTSTYSENTLRDIAVTGTDLLTQMGVFRNAENLIRDTLNLDIFSLRTLVLQNIVFGNSVQNVDSSSRWTAGNFLDNTTVYMGKYFGSSLYVDALLHFSYYDRDVYQNRVYENTMFPAVFGNLLFLPEIGLEFDSPFGLIRWGISPIPEDNNITLSWRFSY